MRGALAALFLGLAGPVSAGSEVLSAQYDEPTTRYAHGVLGDTVEWGALVMRLDTCPECALLRTREYRIDLPESRVFEDLEPRVLDLDRDGDNEVLVIESHKHKGARVAVYDENGLLAYGPYRMRRFRWLAIIGAADFDNDGQIEVAYIDRPHLVKKLKLLRFQPGMMPFVAEAPGFTNHKIGEDFISGGLRTCAGRLEMIVADAGWTQIMAVAYDGQSFSSTPLAPYTGPSSFDPVMTCGQ